MLSVTLVLALIITIVNVANFRAVNSDLDLRLSVVMADEEQRMQEFGNRQENFPTEGSWPGKLSEQSGSERYVLFKGIDIEIGRRVDFFTDVFAVFSALLDTFSQQILYLSVDGTEIALCTCGNGIIELFREPQRYLFLCCH